MSRTNTTASKKPGKHGPEYSVTYKDNGKVVTKPRKTPAKYRQDGEDSLHLVPKNVDEFEAPDIDAYRQAMYMKHEDGHHVHIKTNKHNGSEPTQARKLRLHLSAKPPKDGKPGGEYYYIAKKDWKQRVAEQEALKPQKTIKKKSSKKSQ
jgi:hypothetical protein